MSIRAKLRRLEDNMASCSECRNAPPTIHAVYPGEEEPETEYCPRCGRSLSIIIRVEYDGEGGA